MTKGSRGVGKRGGGFEKYVLNSAKMGNVGLAFPTDVQRIHGPTGSAC